MSTDLDLLSLWFHLVNDHGCTFTRQELRSRDVAAMLERTHAAYHPEDSPASGIDAAPDFRQSQEIGTGDFVRGPKEQSRTVASPRFRLPTGPNNIDESTHWDEVEERYLDESEV
jgi:hypothetical protein